MATKAHCAYCFECLSASLENRPALGLKEVESLWAKYNDSVEEEDQNLEDDEQTVETAESVNVNNSHRPAAISRLLAPSPSSASSSSPSTSSSTPSLPIDGSSTASKSSSRSSFFSLGRKSKSDEIAASSGEYPLFVTWNTIGRSGSKHLRGCIGTFEAQELDDGLRSYALTSAFDDTRFMPIPARELPVLECGVTLLTNFEPAADPMAWEIGKHGLRISFSNHGRRYGSTYLPDVARDQGWTKEETMISLMRKAGWSGRKDDWRKVSDLNVVTYQGNKVALEYKEWREWRDWVEENDLA